jgi:mRNA interferase MazF
MRRGEIWLVDLEPVRGSEANKRRPAVVVSNDAANSTAEQLGRGVVTVVPVTSNLRRVYPFQTLLPAEETGLRTDSKALAEQVRSVDAQRLSSHIATIPPQLMADLDDALRIHLAL